MSIRPLAEINRSEMWRSVILSQVIGRHAHLNKLVQHWGSGWTMRGTDGVKVPLNIGPPFADIMATALFHARRDITRADSSFALQHAQNIPSTEIDVVIVIPDLVAIGFELKWESIVIGINGQLTAERPPLQLVAKYYSCPYTSLGAILPRIQSVPEADFVLTTSAIAEFTTQLNSEFPDDLSIKETYHSFKSSPIDAEVDWDTYTSAQFLHLIQSAADETDDLKWVGYESGLENLMQLTVSNIKDRPHWKVRGTRPTNSRWLPLSTMRKVILELIAKADDRPA